MLRKLCFKLKFPLETLHNFQYIISAFRTLSHTDLPVEKKAGTVKCLEACFSRKKSHLFRLITFFQKDSA